VTVSGQPDERPVSSWFTRPGRVALLATLLAGLPFLLFGTVQFARQWHSLAAGEEAVGTVVATRAETDEEPAAAVVAFTTAEGDDLRFVHKVSAPERGYALGERVRVIYDPRHPGRGVQLAAWRTLWLQPTLLAVLGAVTIVAGALVFAVTEGRRRRREGGAGGL